MSKLTYSAFFPENHISEILGGGNMKTHVTVYEGPHFFI